MAQVYLGRDGLSVDVAGGRFRTTAQSGGRGPRTAWNASLLWKNWRSASEWKTNMPY